MFWPKARSNQTDAGTTDDARLMQQVGQGDAQAFATLVHRHSPRVYRVALRMAGNAADAEDVMQECFTRMWQNAPGWRPTGAGLPGWLYRLTINLCLDRHRRLRIIPTDLADDLVDRLADEAPTADRLVEAREAEEAISLALRDLPERYRAALVLCYHEGISNAAAADILDLNLKAMESLLVRARKQLRSLLEARHFGAGDCLGDLAERAA